MSSALAIRSDRLVKHYEGRPPVEAVRGVDLAVERGECFGLLGPNGAGKTTTIEMIEGLLEPTSGAIEVLGMSWSRDAAEIRQRIGISLQETKLPEKLAVLEVLTLFRSFYRQGLAPADAMRYLGLEEKARAWVGKLSGGQRQRLAVACALVGDPELLLLDEPTTGLDPHARRQLWESIQALRAQGRTVLLTTHYMDEAEKLCDRVAIVDQGRVIALGSPRELIARLGGEHVVELTLVDGEGVVALEPHALEDLPTVRWAHREQRRLSLAVVELHLALPPLLERLRGLGVEMASLATRHASLEDVFVSLTGRRLREAENGNGAAPARGTERRE